MLQANVKKISNGFMVSSPQVATPNNAAIQNVYALTIAEVAYWVGRILDPVAGSPALAQANAPAPSIIEPPADPTVGQLANVVTVDSGGFIVTQLPSVGSGAQLVEVYCVNMDAVTDALTQIYTAPVAE